AAGWRQALEGDAEIVVRHVDDLAFPVGEVLHDAAETFFGNFHPDAFEGFHFDAVFKFVDDGRTGDKNLVSFAAHLLDENGDLHRSASADPEGAARVGDIFDIDRDVSFRFAEKTFAKLAGSDEFAFASGERAVVDAEIHLNRRRIEFDEWQWRRVFRGRQGDADIDFVESGEADNSSGFRDRILSGAESGELENLGDF